MQPNQSYNPAADYGYAPEYERYYNEKQGKDYADYGAKNQYQLGDYDNTIQDYQNSLNSDLDTLNDNEGRNGTWGSSARQTRVNNLQNKYNSAFNKAYNSANYNYGQNQRDYEYQYGAGNLRNQAPLYRSNTNLGNYQNNLSSTAGQAYNPFGYVGRVNAEKNFRTANSKGDYWNSLIQ